MTAPHDLCDPMCRFHDDRAVPLAHHICEACRDQPCAECGVEEFRHEAVDGCSGFRPLPAPGGES